MRGDYYFSLSENNRIRAVKITAPRGYVLDRNGAVLVENEPAYTLHLYRREAKDLDASVEFIVELLGLNPEQVRSRVERGRRDPEFVPIPIAENLGIEEVAAVEARARGASRVRDHGLAAAPLQARRRRPPTRSGTSPRRRPSRSRTPAIVYGVGDWIGQKGIESAYERLLAGASGERRVIVDSHGREVAEEARLEAIPGQNLFLTLDSKLQDVAEEYFKDARRIGRRHGSEDRRDPRAGLLARPTTRTGSRAA